MTTPRLAILPVSRDLRSADQCERYQRIEDARLLMKYVGRVRRNEAYRKMKGVAK